MDQEERWFLFMVSIVSEILFLLEKLIVNLIFATFLVEIALSNSSTDINHELLEKSIDAIIKDHCVIFENGE